jgi:hypothetical protein
MTKQLERELDDVLQGRTVSRSQEVESLFRVASLFAGQTPDLADAPNGLRSLFAQAIGTRRSMGWLRFLPPAILTAAVLVILLLLGRTAVPGEAFYPVRQALRSVGLAPASVEEIDDLLAAAQVQLANAEEIDGLAQQRARRLALNSVRLLGGAEQLLEDIDDEAQAESRYAALSSLLGKAQDILLEDDDLTDENAARRDDENDARQDAEDTEGARGGNEGPGSQEPTDERNENEGPNQDTAENRTGARNQNDGDEGQTKDTEKTDEGNNEGKARSS